MDQETKEQIWQQRFGHLGVRNLQKLAAEKLVDGFNYDISKELQFCEPCSEGKHHRTSFPINHSKRSDKPLDIVHSDLCGKMNAKSLSGAEYFLTFIDDNTRYVWVYVLKRKDEVFERFLEWKAQVERKTGRKLKALRTDNGGEYTSTDFKAYLRTEGVRHELTVPKTPEQNSVAERMNRTLVETVRAMLADTKLPHKFWAEAVSTAVYLRNRSPSKAVKGMTPYEAWTGERPNVNHLRAFGCAVHAHISKDERRKLDPKSRKCILLGYGTTTKGYRLYDPQRTRVFYSRDVLFNELERGIKEIVQEEKRCVQLDSVTEKEPVTKDTPEPVLRRSEKERRLPIYYGEWANMTNTSKIESLGANDVWDLVELPRDRRAVGSKWVFKLKVAADGSTDRYKARLVAQGFSQKFGVDYDETFCPVVRPKSVRAVIALAAQNDLKLHQMDVTTVSIPER